ncbi:MAG: transglycosylase SLT domain-containing protein [Pseudohongiellaceae bacterium]|nr:transglycosylase SLT domain-containing protein [Pseudohongiellaceae bacterium]
MNTRVLGLFFLVFLVGCASSPPRNTSNVCSMFEDRRSWFKAAERTEKRWGVPVGVSMAIILQESGFRARAKPERTKILWVIPGPRPSNAYGYAQALDSTWEEYKRSSGNGWASRADFDDAIDFVGWYNANSYRRNGIGRHDARNLYLAYHEGNGGYAQGTYRNKQWLLDVADRVQRNADRYSQQYAQCKAELGRGWFRRLLF